MAQSKSLAEHRRRVGREGLIIQVGGRRRERRTFINLIGVMFAVDFLMPDLSARSATGTATLVLLQFSLARSAL